MENMIQVFENKEFGKVRTIEENGKVMFVASDVAKALGYSRPADAITAHCKGSVKHRLPTNGGMQDLKIIPERDVYHLVVYSKLPAAKRFEAWIKDMVSIMDNVVTVANIRGYISANGAVMLNAEDVARGWGFTQLKNGVEYVRWDRVNNYLSEFGFPHKWGKIISSLKTWSTGWASRLITVLLRNFNHCLLMKFSLLFVSMEPM